MKNFSRLFILAGLTAALTVVAVGAQDFSKTYTVPAGSPVSVKSVSGNVKVKAGDGNAVTVVGIKKGRDADKVTIEDQSTANKVNVSVKYPEHCNCQASVDFEVTVPYSMALNYDWASVSGNIHVDGGNGTIKARSVSGNVTLKNATGNISVSCVSGEVSVEGAKGTVTAKSTSGNVKVDLARVDGTSPLEFSSVSGNVVVSVPSGVGADVEMSTLSGSLHTDFPINVEERKYGPGKSAKGRVGDGARVVKMTSVSGNLNLSRS